MERIKRMIVLFFFLPFVVFGASGCGDNRINPAGIAGPSTTTTITLDSSQDEDLKLVKKYNSDLQGGKATRWDKSVVTVYDSTGLFADLQSVLNEWNAVLAGRMILAIGNSNDKDIEIKINDSIIKCGQATYFIYDSKIYAADILLKNFNDSFCFGSGSLLNPKKILMHEFGHVIGFGIGNGSSDDHNNDGGLMTISGGNGRITDEVSRMLNRLYSLVLGTIII